MKPLHGILLTAALTVATLGFECVVVVHAQETPPAQTSPEATDEAPFKKEIYYYQSEAVGRRDPFMSLILASKKEDEADIEAPPLQKYDISQMKLYAVVLTQKQQYAMIRLPDGKHYTVHKGDDIGIRDGYIASMSLGEIVIIERIKDYKGRVVDREVFLRLRKEEAE